MSAPEQLRRWFGHPWVRAVVLLILLLLALALAWHLVGMADHSAQMGMLGGACLAVLAVGLLILFPTPASQSRPLPAVGTLAAAPAPSRLPPRFGRHPPVEGVVLLM